MAYRIHEGDGFVEVQISEETSVEELLGVIRELRDRDPRKEISDLWSLSEDSIIPIASFASIVASVAPLCPRDIVGRKTAVVASNELHRAVLDIYRAEAARLPFAIGVFTSREEAVHWLKA